VPAVVVGADRHHDPHDDDADDCGIKKPVGYEASTCGNSRLTW
jgi:hypothetical protein